ncbi:hypothetical protein BK809_0001472 [Diplodia seriata]|uniref:Uncharacterized protein n=1 Tax=Diplodia seriata TaxID=420778 RepID=A0A1S8B9P0_9PEZI|nr:hypothetical protein BK809_0001472 [Diplodia seriata]
MTTNQDDAAVRETVATCCPRNYACMTTVSQGWDFQSTLPCESHWPGGDGRGPTTVTATALLNGVTSLTVRTVSSLDAINNYGVIVRRQATDNNVPSSATATATTMSTALSSSSSTPTPARTGSDIHQGATATATATATSSSSASAERSTGGSAGLSTAAKVGIGIGAVLLVVSALALGFLVGRRNKQKGRERRGGGGGAGSPVEHVFSPGGDLKGGPLPRGFGRSEVDGRAQRVELPGVRDAVHELYGDEAAADRGMR